MTHVALLLSAPAAHCVDAAALATAAALLPSPGTPHILREGQAAEIPFEHAHAIARADRKALATAMRDALRDRPVDVAVLPDANRRKRLLVADMDSTMIAQECIDELADVVGLKDRIAAITERAMRGEIAFEPALRERVALLAGLDLGVIDDLIATRLTAMAGAKTLLATLRAHGAYTALVSGGFTAFTGPIAATLGFHEHHANRLDLAEGRLTGRVVEPILGREAKRATLEALAARLGLEAEDTLAVGDGANDLAMLEAAGLGVAFRAKPAVAAVADVRIDHGDLTSLLHLQGFTSADFVEA